MGGKDIFVAMLDSVFNVPPFFDETYYGGVIHEIREMQIMGMGNYAHGNQPIQHMIYLYDWAGQPWKAQQRVREVMDRFYTPAPDGYCGDEDNGQTSAWYVFSALGFYPVCPGSGEYAIGTPYFRKATVTLPAGKTLSIEAVPMTSPSQSDSQPLHSVGAERLTREDLPPFIQRMTLNGESYSHNYLRHDDILRGGTLHFDLSSTPNLTRGTSSVDAPYSFSNEK